MKFIVLAAVCVVGTASLAAAQTTTTPRIDARQANQQARINQGVASGQLTNREANNLQRGQARVQRMENRAAADGVVTKGEQARINQVQNNQSKKIFNKKHNGRVQ
jgi:opacity protein-like surface antigen